MNRVVDRANIFQSRQMIGKQPFRGQVWCCGRSDEAHILSEIVGWAVGCKNERDKAAEVADLQARGFLTTRRHIAPAGEWDAYALTDKGFDRLAAIGYGDMYDQALRLHLFYAAQAPCKGAQGLWNWTGGNP